MSCAEASGREEENSFSVRWDGMNGKKRKTKKAGDGR